MPAAAISGWSSPLPWPAADQPLTHGYTVIQVSRLAIDAVRRLRWVRAFDYDESLLAAHHAMIVHLYTAPGPPQPDDLVRAGMRGASRRRITEMTHHGIPTSGSGRGDGSHFLTYWDHVTAHTHPPEEHITEHTALHQVWHALTPGDRAVLAARADSATPSEAARRLGLTTAQYHHRMIQARLRFRTLWHEGEQPSRNWRKDRPATSNPKGTITARAFATTRHRATHPAPPKPRKKIDIGITSEELITRYYNGETLRSLATACGVSTRTISLRLYDAGHQPYTNRDQAPSPAPKPANQPPSPPPNCSHATTPANPWAHSPKPSAPPNPSSAAASSKPATSPPSGPNTRQ